MNSGTGSPGTPRISQATGAAAVAGGALWIALTFASIGAWERANSALSYELVNGLRPLSLALIALGMLGLYQQSSNRIGRYGRLGFWLSLVALFISASGAALEFWVGGGVRDGDVDTLSLAGWSIYLGGFFLLSFGLILFGIAFQRARVWNDQSWPPLAAGLAWAAWFPAVMLGNVMSGIQSELVQVLFGLFWVIIGALTVTRSFALYTKEGKV